MCCTHIYFHHNIVLAMFGCYMNTDIDRFSVKNLECSILLQNWRPNNMYCHLNMSHTLHYFAQNEREYQSHPVSTDRNSPHPNISHQMPAVTTRSFPNLKNPPV